jgi:ATP-binding cassette subfamily B protein
MLWEDRGELGVLLAYILVTGVLSLAVPLAAQALVNTIAAGFSLQPLIVLTLLVLGGLLFAGMLRFLQLALVETLQQRVFARVALRLAYRLPRVRQSALAGEYAPELVNRFFDVLTIQKTFSKLLLDGVAAALQAGVGLVLIAFYNPLLLAFALFILVAFTFIAVVLGAGGLRTSIRESIQKYRVADWLEELARCQTSFKMNAGGSFLMDRADELVLRYLTDRRAHFTVVCRQAIGNYLFQAVASAGTLGIGGWLVINRQLTLGQLVAAELIVVSVLAALDKLIKQAEQVYDLLTALDKIGHVTDLPLEREDGQPLPPRTAGARVSCRGVRFSYHPGAEVLNGLDLALPAGARVSLVGLSGAGKTTLAALLCGLEEPSHGTVEINGMEVRAASLESLRRAVSLVGDDHEIFAGTLEENVVVGRSHVTHEDVRWALDVAQLTHDLALLPHGTRTQLVSGGRNLSHGQAQRLLIARAIVDRPELLILDEAFTGIDEKTKLAILDALYAPEHQWTLIDISHDAEVVMRSGTVHVLGQGRIVESGSPELLASQPGTEFAAVFPDLARQVIRMRSEAPGGLAAVNGANTREAQGV